MAAPKIALKHLQQCEALNNFQIDCVDDNVLEWRVLFEPQTERHPEQYVLRVVFPSDYPFKAPSVQFVTSVNHPNVDENGKICVGSLTDWTVSSTMLYVFQSIYSLFLEPNLDDPVNLEAVKWWRGF